MGKIIVLSTCTDKNVLQIFEKLKTNVSFDWTEQTESNPFIQYIEQAGKIDEELLDFLYHSDFLSQITEKTLPFIKQLYEKDAQIEWFYLVQKVFEEAADNVDEYMELIEQCFSHGIDCSAVEQAVEDIGWSDITTFQEKISPYMGEKNTADDLKKQIEREYKIAVADLLFAAGDPLPEQQKIKERISDIEKGEDEKYGFDFAERLHEFYVEKIMQFRGGTANVNLKEVNRTLTEQCEKVSGLLQEAYEIIRNNKRQEMTLKMQIDSLKKNHSFMNRLLERERKKNADFFLRIQELEEENDVLQKEVADLKEQLHPVNRGIENGQNEKTDRLSQDESLKSEYDDVSSAELEAAWKNALNDDEEMPENESKQEEDYSTVSFISNESEQEADRDETQETSADVLPEEPYQYTDVKKISSGEEVIKRKSRWFLEHLFGHCKKNFLKKSRADQEGLIFIKMMELHFPMEKSRIVKEGLSNLGDKVPCFDLYKLICKNPTKNELLSFLGGFKEESINEQ